jgi:hypothetical protein
MLAAESSLYCLLYIMCISGIRKQWCDGNELLDGELPPRLMLASEYGRGFGRWLPAIVVKLDICSE